MKPEVPKDLGLKIGTPEEVFWTTVKDSVKKQISDSQAQIDMNKHMLPYVERRIKEEQRRAKV